MRSFGALAVAIAKGFVRDKQSVFFAVVFPLMFLVLFGGLFGGGQSAKIEMVRVGEVPILDALPPGAQEAYAQTFEVRESEDRAAAIADVRSGDADVAVEMVGDRLVAHYTQTDQAAAARTAGTLRAFVDGANVAASGEPPRYEFVPSSVEDDSLNAIQYFTPGLLGWAVAMSAAIGAAADGPWAMGNGQVTAHCPCPSGCAAAGQPRTVRRSLRADVWRGSNVARPGL